GSISPHYLVAADPALVLVSADHAVYARGAYRQVWQGNAMTQLQENVGRFKEELLSAEVGHTVIRINNAKTWSYECYHEGDRAYVPVL
ncbi:MAG: hypothetical protein AAF570_19685, partial [Bacteroidota bacterium]